MLSLCLYLTQGFDNQEIFFILQSNLGFVLIDIARRNYFTYVKFVSTCFCCGHIDWIEGKKVLMGFSFHWQRH